MSHVFLRPVREKVNLNSTPKDKCVLNQSVVAVMFGAPWRPPHLSQNDAQMLLESLRGIFADLINVSGP